MSIRYASTYIYFLLFLAFMLGVELNLKKHGHETKYVNFFTIIVFACFFGLKGFVGHDNLFFYNVFEDYPVLQNFHGFDTFENGELYEPGFTIFAIICKTLGMDFWGFQFLGTLIDALILYVVIRRESPIFTLALIIYITMGGLLLHLEQIRNAHGVVLFLYALRFVREKRPIPYILICAFATLMHYTSIIFLLAYPFLAMEFSKKTKMIIVSFALIVFFFHIRYIDGIMSLMYKFSGDAIQGKIERYFRGELLVSNYAFSIRHIVIFISCYFFIYAPEKVGLEKIDNTLQNVFLASIITIFCFCELNALENRLSQLFIGGIAFLYPQMLVNMSVRLYKQVIAVCLVLYAFLRVSSAMTPYYFEYHTCFQVTKSSREHKWAEYNRFVEKTTASSQKIRRKEEVKIRSVDQLKRESK